MAALETRNAMTSESVWGTYKMVDAFVVCIEFEPIGNFFYSIEFNLKQCRERERQSNIPIDKLCGNHTCSNYMWTPIKYVQTVWDRYGRHESVWMT